MTTPTNGKWTYRREAVFDPSGTQVCVWRSESDAAAYCAWRNGEGFQGKKLLRDLADECERNGTEFGKGRALGIREALAEYERGRG